MARRRRGRPLNGWLVIDKPIGITSTQAMAKARWALQAQKAGHAGTLDPLATGVLAIAFGEATKTVAAAQDGQKTYRFTIRLGQATATDDAEGKIVAESPERPDDAALAAALAPFRGDIMQVPPIFSAVKQDGARAYDLARAGEIPELAPRPLHVARLELVARPDADHAELELDCGKGGYVRSIARDIGRVLGCHAHVTALRRLASGGFRIEDALPFDRLDAVREGRAEAPLLPVAAGLRGLVEIPLPPVMAAQLRVGQAVPLAPGRAAEGETVWASCAGTPVAICKADGARLRPARVILPDTPVAADGAAAAGDGAGQTRFPDQGE
ncbi:tRNA pseudouridine(55) synthase TruB [Paralimibaculum aggregatum]|uniref:tRNA pseudouridine synthase B n=1 Tax=Paralimibaculum aggregatum TaxID=3036245 RepID=A0ABQ6LQH7_9RHOB|nr:tRNA pseudouridine(55) synthase TruB [Limibaculum sp. NKW23]GMG83788.1 tRNA pseudouridine(55) synthase TruB [Limibaculum sp. NKW23]